MFKKLSFMFLALCISVVAFSSVYCINVNVGVIETGDVIYFDNSATHWDNVKIYIFHKENDKSTDLKSWDNSDNMTRIGDTDIWKFEITSDMDVDGKLFDWVIFHNGKGNGENQTIDLRYINPIYAFKVDGTEDNKKNGYWYAYDKSELEQLVEDCKKYEEKYYTEESWAAFETSLNEAKNGLKNELRIKDANNGMPGWECEYLTTVSNLKNAINKLIVDNSALQEKINEVKKKDTTGYTQDTIDALNSAISDAEKKIEGTLTVDEIKEQIQKLDDAINNLKTNKDIFKEKVQKGKDILDTDSKYYTDDSIKKLEEALNSVQSVLDNDKATVEDVNNAIKQVEDAINDLEFNDKLLDDLIEKENSTDFNKYTDESSNTLKEAIKEAEDLKTRGNVTVEEFKDIEKKINDGISNLVEKSAVNNTKNPNTGSYIFGVILMLLVATAVFVYTIKYGKKAKNNN